jgi:hypothetical protein
MPHCLTHDKVGFALCFSPPPINAGQLSNYEAHEIAKIAWENFVD